MVDSFIIDNLGIVLNIFIIIALLTYVLGELIPTVQGKSNDKITKKHLDKHINIMVQGLVAFAIATYGVYGLSVAPMDYFVSSDVMDKVFILQMDGFYHIDWDIVKYDKIKAVISILSSRYSIMFFFGIAAFFYVAIHHLKEERLERHSDNVLSTPVISEKKTNTSNIDEISIYEFIKIKISKYKKDT